MYIYIYIYTHTPICATVAVMGRCLLSVGFMEIGGCVWLRVFSSFRHHVLYRASLSHLFAGRLHSNCLPMFF